MGPNRGFLLSLVALPWLVAVGVAQSPLARLEARYDSMRYLRDQLDVTRARRATESIHGVARSRLEAEYAIAWRALASELGQTRETGLGAEDRRALKAIRAAVRRSPDPTATVAGADRAPYAPDSQLAGAVGRTLDSLQRAVYARYAAAASQIIVAGDTLDRLTILGRLATTDDRARRERIWKALDQVWSTVNGHGEPDAPYRRLVALRRRLWGTRETPIARLAGEMGLSERTAEAWLVRALEAWRATLPDSGFAPWDIYHFTGAANRRLSDRVPRDTIFSLAARYYRAIGADLDDLGVHFANRPGQVAVAYTTFAATGRWNGGVWDRIEPWVFTAYRIGGLDNLNELLHEVGHAVHIAAIRARPAFNDWPDSDLFTEAVADLAMVEMYEPAWQTAFLGQSAPLEESLRSKYAGIVFDLAWALFEYRVHRPGAPPPNQLWTEITHRYLAIEPHPEYSWWAARGQLVNLPGYLSSYALGAFLVADLRQAATRRFGAPTAGNREWYQGVAQALYRPGLAIPAKVVVERFLGRPLSPDALLADLARIRRPAGR